MVLDDFFDEKKEKTKNAENKFGATKTKKKSLYDYFSHICQQTKKNKNKKKKLKKIRMSDYVQIEKLQRKKRKI